MTIDGKRIAEEIRRELEVRVRGVGKSASRRIRLAIIQAGENEVSAKFIKQKEKFASEAWIETRIYNLPQGIFTNELRKKVAEVCHIKQNDGVIIQLPLPKQINTQYILNGIILKKDVDVLSEKAMGKFLAGKGILPPVTGAVKEIFDRHKVEVKGKNIVIVGAGMLVGKPTAIWLINEGATVTVLNEFTLEAKSYLLKANIIVSGVGKPGIITEDMVREGAIVIDAGTSEQSGKLVGDVSPDVEKMASLFTPVPGGVGPITVAMVFKNLLELNRY